MTDRLDSLKRLEKKVLSGEMPSLDEMRAADLQLDQMVIFRQTAAHVRYVTGFVAIKEGN